MNDKSKASSDYERLDIPGEPFRISGAASVGPVQHRQARSSVDAMREETARMRAVVSGSAGQGVLDAMKLDGDSGRGNVVGFRREGDRLVLLIGDGSAAFGPATLRALAGVLMSAAQDIDEEARSDR